MRIADEWTLESWGCDDIELPVLVSGKEEIVTISNVYFISELKSNLLSFETLEKKGLECHTKNERMRFLDSDSNIVIQTTQQAESALYLLNLTANAQQKALELAQTMTVRVWEVKTTLSL